MLRQQWRVVHSLISSSCWLGAEKGRADVGGSVCTVYSPDGYSLEEIAHLSPHLCHPITQGHQLLSTITTVALFFLFSSNNFSSRLAFVTQTPTLFFLPIFSLDAMVMIHYRDEMIRVCFFLLLFTAELAAQGLREKPKNLTVLIGKDALLKCAADVSTNNFELWDVIFKQL